MISVLKCVCCSADVNSVVNFVPRAFNHIWSNSCDCSRNLLPKVNLIPNLFCVNNDFYIPPEK